IRGRYTIRKSGTMLLPKSCKSWAVVMPLRCATVCTSASISSSGYGWTGKYTRSPKPAAVRKLVQASSPRRVRTYFFRAVKMMPCIRAREGPASPTWLGARGLGSARLFGASLVSGWYQRMLRMRRMLLQAERADGLAQSIGSADQDADFFGGL